MTAGVTIAAIGALEPVGVAHAAAMAAIHRLAFPPSEAWGTDAIALQLALPGVFGWLDRRGGMILARVAADEVEVLTLAVAARGAAPGGSARTARRGDDAGGVARRTDRLPGSLRRQRRGARAVCAAPASRRSARRPRYYADGTDALVAAADAHAGFRRSRSSGGLPGGRYRFDRRARRVYAQEMPTLRAKRTPIPLRATRAPR